MKTCSLGPVATLTLVSGLLGTADAGRAAEPRSAKICGACHGPIKRQWEGSAMAHSWRNPVFQAFLGDARAALGDSIQAVCVRCHAPLAAVTGDPTVQDPVAQEGVTCNFCHNVSSVELSMKPGSYTWDGSDPNLMRGPYDDSDPGSAHRFLYTEIHTKSEFCASCHSFASPGSGVVIEPTYADWKRSAAAAAGRRCQDCHMPSAPGKASPLSKRNRKAVSAHFFQGPRTPGFLDSVATLSATLQGGRLKLTVANRGAGHALPGGGNSMRSLSLGVRFLDPNGAVLDSTRVATYGVEFADAEGRSPVPKWLAASVARSTAIPPDSVRVEWCDVAPGSRRAVATLLYHLVHPSYQAGLAAKGVGLAASAAVLLAQATVEIP